MAMSKEQARIRRWFQRHGWSTGNTPTGMGFYIESPVENEAGGMHSAFDTDTEKAREFCWEKYMDIELDRFNCDYVTISIHKRRHWWKQDPSIPAGDHGGYRWVPSDDFEKWRRTPDASIDIPAADILKLAELIKEAQADWLRVRKSRKHLNFMERIAKSCCIRWIGVNSSYEEIKWTYSNERLREERGFAAFSEKEGGDAK